MIIEIIERTVTYFFNIVFILILARVLMSWFPKAHGNQFVRLLYSLTEPILAPIRSLLRKTPLGGPGMMIDFSPVIAFLLLNIVQSLISNILQRFL